MAQLKCYYFDYKEQLPESAYMHQLLGLNLLFLLSQNRVAEFHTELERLPAKDIQTNVYIKHPVSLEQYLMEGSYNKVFLAKGNIPAESYTFFIDILLDTIRDEIAGCIEKAYEKILFTEATRILFFNTPISHPSLSAARVGLGPQQLLQLCQPTAEARRYHHPLHGAGQTGHRVCPAAGDDRLSPAGTGVGQGLHY
uniref:26S proteasome non-ATPase regulatory subunit 8 n=1 Tax=Rousettus aegyptiacus TaxID=9407 RepID=A0A7J8CKQ5_ROUAE|nr:proteasome 26S subunit, non-ATPase 8 [Rousettus aegyptiacus]